MNWTNIILNTDSYKTSHFEQYPPNTEFVYSYIESRGGKFDRTLMFGLQMFIKEYLLKPITQSDIDEAEAVISAHGLPFNRAGWEYILNNYQGFLPLEIRAIDEGYVVPVGIPLVTVVNTDPKCFWVTSYIETALLRAIWYPTTVATNSWHCKQIIKNAIDRSSDNPEQISFKLHDFGARGVSSLESAAIGGAAHLVNFMGTDTISGLMAARRFYNEPMAGFSIPAAEHSTITSWGSTPENEKSAYENMIEKFAKPGSLVAVVSDSFDLDNAVNNIWGKELKEKVISSGATIVVRPDSGDPLNIPIKVIEDLSEHYGYTINSKGYKVLPSCIRVIQGDGITVDSLPKIIDNLLWAGFAIDNLAFGMGGGLLQQVNRDTQRFAMKCSAIRVNGKWRDTFKDPKTDHAKKSKRGRFFVEYHNNEWILEELNSAKSPVAYNMLKVKYNNGYNFNTQSFANIRTNSEI